MLIALPVLLGAVIYAFVDHRIGIQANFGADGVGAWIAWAYSVPAVIVYAIPAVGVAAELMPVTFKHRQPMRGQIFAGIALVGVAALAVVSMQRVHELSLDKSQQFGDFVDDLLPFLIFAGLPVLGLLMVMGLGGLTAQERSRQRPPAGHGGVPLRQPRRGDDPARRDRQRRAGDHQSRS